MNEKMVKTNSEYWFNQCMTARNEKYQLEHNWNELKKWVEEEKPTEDMNENFIMIRLSDLKNKMQELEEGGNNE